MKGIILIFAVLLTQGHAHDDHGADEVRDVYALVHNISVEEFLKNKRYYSDEILKSSHEAVETTLPPLKGTDWSKVTLTLKKLEESLSINRENMSNWYKWLPWIWNTGVKIPYAIARYAHPSNFREISYNVQRWFNMFQPHAPQELEKHMMNLALLYVASHTTESVFGPLFGTLGPETFLQSLNIEFITTMLESPVAIGALRFGGTLAGFMIAVPGLDPLCIIMGASYVRYPQLRRVTWEPIFSVPRIVLFKGGKFLYKAVGAKALMAMLLETQDFKDYLIGKIGENPRILVKTKKEQLELNFNIEGEKPIIDIKLKMGHKGQYYLSELIFYEDAKKLSRAEIRKRVALFGVTSSPFNTPITEAILQAHKRFRANDLESFYENAFYVKKTSIHQGSFQIEYFPNSIRLKRFHHCLRHFQ